MPAYNIIMRGYVKTQYITVIFIIVEETGRIAF